MFLKIFPSLKDNEVIQGLNKVLSSPFYIAFVAIMITLSAIFNVGFSLYYVLAVTSIIIPCFFGEDMTALVPLAVMLNVGINKELASMDERVILGPNLPHFIIMLCIVIFFMFGRLVFDLIVEKERKHRFPRLLVGYALISISFIFGGLLSPFYSIKDFTFGLREFLALAGFYFYFFYTIDLPKMKKYYFAWLLLFFAMSISAQILVEAIRSGLESPLLVGWGNRSGLGGTLVACFTGCAYLIIKAHGGISWVFTLLYLFFFTMIGLTQCRGAALTAMIMSLVCLILIFIFGTKGKRITTIVLLVLYIIGMTLFSLLEREFFQECFGRIFNFDFDSIDKYSSGRITIWKTGIEQFTSHPVFGVGWYQMVLNNFPARYHNTAIQLLAATGVVGVVAYLVHRFETIFITLKRPSLDKSFAFIAILCILISSLLDCFLFNIWLGFLYGFLLAFIEGRNMKPVILKPKEPKPNPNMQVYQTGPTTIVIVKK